MAHAAAGQTPLPLYLPKMRVQSGQAPDAIRIYSIRDEHGRRHNAYRVVVDKGTLGDYYGVQGMDWAHPPILNHPSQTEHIGKRTYELFYNGRRLRLVAWRARGAVFWVSNTLEGSLNDQQMLAIARATRVVH
jgi:hypothetical protein